MDTALGLLPALPPSSALVFALRHGLGGVPVADRSIAEVEQIVGGDVVLLDVRLHLLEGPVC